MKSSAAHRVESEDCPEPHAMPDQRSPPATTLLSSLESNWRRVASTHTLQDLLEAEHPPGGGRPPSWRLLVYGVALIAAGAGSMLLCVAAILVLPMLPPVSNTYARAVQVDRYYQLLVPLTVPVTILAVFINWMSMKLFKHNS